MRNLRNMELQGVEHKTSHVEHNWLKSMLSLSNKWWNRHNIVYDGFWVKVNDYIKSIISNSFQSMCSKCVILL